MTQAKTIRVMTMLMAIVMLLGVVPFSAFASIPNWADNNVVYDGTTFGTNGYYNVISKKDYVLVPGAAVESEIVLNNAAGTRRQVLHVIEVDPSNPDVSIVPGYNQIDKLAADPTNEANWSHKELTEMAKYYEDNLGYNIVGGMNTDLYYDTYAPRILVYNGKSIGVKGEYAPSSSILYVFKDAEGNISCDVKAYSKADFDKYLADGILLHAVSVSFGMVVKDGELVTKKEERTSDPAARSMVGVKADGTLVICMNDGRGANNSVGFCNYEEGEAMLALGCQWAANCDGGGSSTFLTKRVGEETFTMRSVPCDGAQRPTAHGIFVASNVAPTGILNNVNVESDYDIFAPNTVYTFGAEAIDTHGYAMDMPADASWALSDTSFGTIADGKFVSNGTTGTVDVQVVSGGQVVGTKTITVADPTEFTLSATSTTIPYSTLDKVRTITLPIIARIGEANVYIDTNAVSVALSQENAGILDGFSFTATDDTNIAGVNVIITYNSTNAQLEYKVEYGKGSEILFDFEDGDVSDFLGVDEMYDWAASVGASAPIQTNGNYSEESDSFAFLSTVGTGGQVRNGNNALGITLDYTNSNYKGWCYNMFFYTGAPTVLRDVANGQKATAFGAWVYIPEGAAGIAMQLSVYKRDKGAAVDSALGFTQLNFQLMMPNGTYQNLNALTEDKIPESRWVYCRADLTPYDYVSFIDPMGTTGREPSFMRYYVKPTVPGSYTFYFDDFTLDYSSAVDDRVLPTITAPTYSTSDTAVSLENNTVVNGNKVAFSATVADNAALDLNSGKIFVDGVELKAAITGNMLSSQEDATLVAGTHTVAFEVKDELGNPAKITRTFTVAGAAVVELSGHNDSNKPAEYDSIYYIDINVADLSKISKLVTTLKLNNANTWETKGAVVANGFNATFEYNEISELLTVTVERDGAIGKALSNTLVSIPVRVWSWQGVNHVTDEPIAPETQFATTYCPVVSIECSVNYGEILFTDNTRAAFGGKTSHVTNLNVNYNPWHYHDAELTVLNKEATTAEAGYENRTYCETCKSVVNWGTIIPKISHEYQIYEGRFVCIGDGCGCGVVYKPGTGTGIFEVNGDLYYFINNELKTGWQDGDNGKYCYASTTSYKLYIGEKIINGVKYVFDDDGLTDGAWVVNSTGTRYSYGPSYYRREWAEIDGKHYYFGRDSYMYTGIRYIKSNPDTDPVWYDFGEDGGKTTQTDPYDYVGLFEYNNELYYIGENGVGVMGLVEVDGDYYYFQFGEGFEHIYYAAMNKSVFLNTTNGVKFPDGTPIPNRTFFFDAEGKMVVNQGVIDGVYYENGLPVSYKGLVKQDGAYYYVTDAGKIVKGKKAFINKTNGLTFPDGNPVLNRNYNFDAEGKLIILNGVVDGVYYENSRAIAYKGLVYQDGYFYYVTDGGKVASSKSYFVKTTNGLTFPDGTPVLNRTYMFNAQGQMEVYNGVVDGVYYENGLPVSYKGLVEQDGAYYYVTDAGKVVKGKAAFINKANGLTFPDGTPVLNRNYNFDAEGKLIILNGVVDGIYYENSRAIAYKGLVYQDGYFYYVTDGGKVAIGKNCFVNTTNGLTFPDGTSIPVKTFYFDAEGKMVY